MNNIMVDLETMGKNSNAAIIAIGAVTFDETGLGSTFYRTIKLTSSVDAGLIMDASTVMWWMKQSDAARKAFNEPGCTLIDALFQFSEWVTTETSDPEIWGNGATFDNVILSNAYEALGLERPWKYWADRCYRTMKAKYPQIVVEKIGTAHNALDDAKSQALHMSRILAHIKGVTHA